MEMTLEPKKSTMAKGKKSKVGASDHRDSRGSLEILESGHNFVSDDENEPSAAAPENKKGQLHTAFI